VIILPYPLPFIDPNSKPRRTFRNPLIVAMEMADEMERKGLTQAELAHKHGISRARVNQWLSLLQLPVGERRRILAMGDNWGRRVVTERMLRKALRT
jgi:DNA-binding transcriptional regulator YiaG